MSKINWNILNISKRKKKNPEIVSGGPGTNLEYHMDDQCEWVSFEARCEEQRRDR